MRLFSSKASLGMKTVKKFEGAKVKAARGAGQDGRVMKDSSGRRSIVQTVQTIQVNSIKGLTWIYELIAGVNECDRVR